VVQRCILFDFDNTLANTESLRDIRETQDYDQLTDERLASVKLYRPIGQTLSALQAQGVTMGIVTNSGAMYVRRLLKHLAIEHFFGVVVTYSDVKAIGMKPSPTGIRLALQKLGIEATPHVLYVGDTNADIEAAYQAGVTPVLPSWASKESTSMAPAIELSSQELCEHFSAPYEHVLFGERCAERKSIRFDRKKTYFLPLDDNANVVTMEDQIATLCFGRYFGQKSAVSAVMHDAHALSREIIKKEDAPVFDIPAYWFDLFAHVIQRAGESTYTGARPFDIVTVIPAKQGKDPRLERLLAGIEDVARAAGSTALFEPDIFYYADDARSQKTLQRNERHYEAQRSLHLTKRGLDKVRGARILIIDDVVTTGATIQRARGLALEAGATSSYAVALAKTVSIAAHEKECTDCGRPMRVVKNSKTAERFWSCTGYAEGACKHTEPFYVQKCPACHRDMRVKTNRNTKEKFWGCTGYHATPQCNFTMDFNPLDSL